MTPQDKRVQGGFYQKKSKYGYYHNYKRDLYW